MKDIVKQILFLDTCTIINLASNTYSDNGEIANKLMELLSSDNFILVIPDQVKKEWDRNKEIKVVKDKIQSFDSKIRNIINFTEVSHPVK